MKRTSHPLRTLLVLSCLATSIGLGCDAEDSDTADREEFRITHGNVDGDAHPGVVMLVFYAADGSGWRCSGTLLSPDVVLTAGHCTGEPGEVVSALAVLNSDIESLLDAGQPLAIVPASDWRSHPQYTNSAFFLHDAGLVRLAAPVELDADDYGTLPGVDALDDLKVGKKSQFTAVGYGLQRVNPVQVEDELVRMYANPHLLQVNIPGGIVGDYSLMLSNNAATGGTCFGDSGGPNFLGDSNVIAGITSFGLNGSCGGTGGVFRVDRANVQEFVYDTMVEWGAL